VRLEIGIVVTVLMYITSLRLQLSPCVNILNLCQNIKLISPIYFGSGAVCSKLSDQRIDIGTKANASFEINTTRDAFEGALLFKLEKCSDNWHDVDASTTETNEKESTYVYMLAAWKAMDSEPFVCVVLLEPTKEFTWNEDKLKELYNKNRDWLKKYDNTTIVTWLMDDNMILRTSFKVRGLKSNFGLSISLSEGRGVDYDMKPIWINTER
jgi:hypothetical protein